jgi:7,8-dihydroneopterin aldolase/epimerase/oxygenase
MTEIEVAGLEVFGRHGVNDDERERGQMFLFDVWLSTTRPATDDIVSTVDYREVRRIVEDVSDAQQYQLLESLAGAVADTIYGELRPERVRVRVRKPGVTWAVYTAATVERP